MFVFTHSERGDQLNTNKKDQCIPDSCYMTEWRSLPLPNSIPTQQCCCCFFLHMPLTAIAPHTSPGQPHFASSEYLWMLLGVHIPLSGRLPGMGLPILSPCSRLSGGLALHPIAVCILPCLAATSVLPVLWRKMRGKKQHGLQVASSQVKKKKKSMQKKDEWRFQGYKIKSTKSMKWKHMLTWCPLPERSMSQTFSAEVNKNPPMRGDVAACHCIYTWALPLYLYFL